MPSVPSYLPTYGPVHPTLIPTRVAGPFDGTAGAATVNNGGTQSESGGSGLRTVALGMSATGKWMRRVALDTFVFTMSDYVV